MKEGKSSISEGYGYVSEGFLDIKKSDGWTDR